MTDTATAPTAAGLDPAARLGLYETMVLSRTYEEAILREYHADKGPGFDIGKGLVPGEMHLSAGQEPVAAGVCAWLTTDDAVTGVLATWLVADGDVVRADQVIAEVQVDKVSADVPAPVSGTVHLAVAEEAEVAQGSVIATIA